MATPSDQQFLRELDKKLWSAADRLRANLDAAVYKHAVLGLIFLKYVSDSFAIRQREIEAQLRDPASDYYLNAEDVGSDADYAEIVRAELEERDYYIEKNVFWVPALARWKTLRDSAKLPPGTEIEVTNGKKTTYKITSTGKLIDDALDAVEKENPKLKGVLNKTYTQLQLGPANLSSLIDLIATIPFEHADLHAKDLLGHVYEYFLGQFALAEGKKGGQYFTPKSIVLLIVEMLEPYQGRVFDPAMSSGGFFVQSERFIEEHGGKLGNLSVYGQDKSARRKRRFGLSQRARRASTRRRARQSNPTTRRLASMNMAIRGIDFNFGKEPANSVTSDRHPDLRADTVMANPPFNISEWWDAKLEGDPRWRYGTPPRGNANFAWIQAARGKSGRPSSRPISSSAWSRSPASSLPIPRFPPASGCSPRAKRCGRVSRSLGSDAFHRCAQTWFHRMVSPLQGWGCFWTSDPGRRSCLACPGLAYFAPLGRRKEGWGMAASAPKETKPIHVPAAYGQARDGWTWARLDDISEGVFDCPHSTPKLPDDGPLVVRTQDVMTGIFRADQAGRVSQETYAERIVRVTPSHGDLLYSREGTYFGIAAEVLPNTRVCLGQRMVLIRPDKRRLDFRFLRHWLNSPIMAAHIHGYCNGTVAERLNLPTIRALPILVPPLPKQKAIAAMLGALDDKIELNRRMNATLEAMARALFQSWFVDFDPVRRNKDEGGRMKDEG